MDASDPRFVIDRIVSAWNDDDAALLDDLVADDYVLHASEGPDMRLQDLKDDIRDVRTMIPDLHHTVDDVVAQGDAVAYRWTMRGRHTGALPDVPPSGNAIDYRGITILHIRDGRIHEEWFAVIGRSMLDQMQAPPSLG